MKIHECVSEDENFGNSLSQNGTKNDKVESSILYVNIHSRNASYLFGVGKNYGFLFNHSGKYIF